MSRMGVIVLAITLVLFAASNVESKKISATLQVKFEAINKTDPAPLHLTFDDWYYAINAFKLGNTNSTPCYNFEYTTSDFGAFITEVCGVKNNFTANLNWMFLVNGIEAPVGVSCLKVQGNDNLTLVYKHVQHKPQPPSKKIPATLRVQFEAIDKPDPAPLNVTFDDWYYAINAFKLGNTNTTPCYNFEYTTGDFGAFVTEVCDVKNNQSENLYWMFDINGKQSPVGISCYQVQENDNLTLVYKDTSIKPKPSSAVGLSAIYQLLAPSILLLFLY
eukprot:TCONS_00054843-protein